MKIAEECLNVPSIITPEEMANPHIPELAVMAYTVQFTKVCLILLIISFQTGINLIF